MANPVKIRVHNTVLVPIEAEKIYSRYSTAISGL
jgi:hypothetical protein